MSVLEQEAAQGRRRRRGFQSRPSSTATSVVVWAGRDAEGPATTVASALALSRLRESPTEIIVVHDCAGDPTWRKLLELKNQNPALHLIDFGAPYGEEISRLEAVRRARTDLVCFASRSADAATLSGALDNAVLRETAMALLEEQIVQPPGRLLVQSFPPGHAVHLHDEPPKRAAAAVSRSRRPLVVGSAALLASVLVAGGLALTHGDSEHTAAAAAAVATTAEAPAASTEAPAASTGTSTDETRAPIASLAAVPVPLDGTGETRRRSADLSVPESSPSALQDAEEAGTGPTSVPVGQEDGPVAASDGPDRDTPPGTTQVGSSQPGSAEPPSAPPATGPTPTSPAETAVSEPEAVPPAAPTPIASEPEPAPSAEPSPQPEADPAPPPAAPPSPEPASGPGNNGNGNAYGHSDPPGNGNGNAGGNGNGNGNSGKGG